MNKLLRSAAAAAIVACIMGVTRPARAEARLDPSRNMGLGVLLGSPMGVTAKWWLNDTLAFDGGIGYGNAGVFYADATYNNWTLFRQPEYGSANLYFGAGPRIATDDGGQLAIRTVAGISYWTKNHPLELFAELAPTLKVTPDHEVGIDGGVGLRYYFHVAVTPAK